MKNLWVAAPHPKYSILFTKSTPWLVPCSAGTRTSSPSLPRIMVVDSSRAAWHKHRWWSLRRGNISAPPSGEGECAGNYPCNFSNTNCLSLASYLSIPHRYCYLPTAPSPITTHHYLVFACIVIVYALHPRWSICIIYKHKSEYMGAGFIREGRPRSPLACSIFPQNLRHFLDLWRGSAIDQGGVFA